MPKIIINLFVLCILFRAGFAWPSGEVNELNTQPDSQSNSTVTALKSAWAAGREQSKSVLVVLGTEQCDRCALLDRYLNDEAMRARIENRFLVLNLDLGSEVERDESGTQAYSLPAIVLVDTTLDFETILQSDQLMTFLPEPHEPVYQWLENVLHFTEYSLASR